MMLLFSFTLSKCFYFSPDNWNGKMARDGTEVPERCPEMEPKHGRGLSQELSNWSANKYCGPGYLSLGFTPADSSSNVLNLYFK